jgi:hypothetical protein
VSLFNITIIAAVGCLLIGVIAIVRGKPLAGFLAVVLAIAIAGLGFREDILNADEDPTPSVPAVTEPATPVS